MIPIHSDKSSYLKSNKTGSSFLECGSHRDVSASPVMLHLGQLFREKGVPTLPRTDPLEPESAERPVGSRLRVSGAAKVRVEYRPARVAYIIPEDNGLSFRTAVREASSRWLGGTELILPIKPGELLGPMWNQFLSFADVDALVFVDLPIQEIAPDGAGKLLPKVAHAQIDVLAPSKYSYHPSFLDPEPRAEATALELITSSPRWLSAAEDSPIWEVAALGLTQAPAEPSPENERLFTTIRHSSIQAGWAQIDQVSLLHRHYRTNHQHPERRPQYLL